MKNFVFVLVSSYLAGWVIALATLLRQANKDKRK